MVGQEGGRAVSRSEGQEIEHFRFSHSDLNPPPDMKHSDSCRNKQQVYFNYLSKNHLSDEKTLIWVYLI